MIDYGILDRSVKHYEAAGFVRIEAPWAVTEAVSDITKPKDIPQCFHLNHNGKVLVASAEQSFLYLAVKGFLPPGRFQAITPCFRFEPYDSLHSKCFMKNELIDTVEPTERVLHATIKDTVRFFSLFFPQEGLRVIETGKLAFDIYYAEVELGSYGIRECEFLKWVYGTGCAEPRLTATLRKYGLSPKTNPQRRPRRSK
jgi:hypothetical protein